MAGHFGRKRTTSRLLSNFYWPTIFKDIADFCRSCVSCQKSTHSKVLNAPLTTLPVLTEPFERIGMDIADSLPRSRSGYRFVLVVCDYATRYPVVVAIESIDAKVIAELVRIFSSVRILKEFLTDQRTNFTSKLLS